MAAITPSRWRFMKNRNVGARYAVPLRAIDIRRMIPLRPKDSNKGKNGHVLIVAGSRGMTGAAILAGLGALKAGAGLLTIAVPESARRIVTGRIPEAMVISQSISAVRACVRRRTITALAVGPRLGIGTAQRKLVLGMLRMDGPIVVDADALNNITPKDLRNCQTIITPHPGELARLLGKSTKEIQKNRVRIATETAKHLNLICVLKGHQTVVSDGVRTVLNT